MSLKDVMSANAKTEGLPLAGVTVVEFCHSVAGPYAGDGNWVIG